MPLSFLVAHAIQLGALALAVAVVLALVARGLPQVRLAAWRAVIASAWLLPLAALWPAVADGPPVVPVPIGPAQVLGSAPRAIEAAVTPEWASWLVLLAALGALGRLLWIGGAIAVLRWRLRSSRPAHLDALEHIQTELGVNARVVCHDDVPRPFTFGDAPGIVVLPEWARTTPPDVLRAILTHELLHVRRRDWRGMVLEECALAPFWFHPAAWIARRELQQAREEIVDRATVMHTGARRRYLETLLALADHAPSPTAFAMPVFTTRQLPRRVAALISEAPMSRLRLLSAALLVLVAASASLAAAARLVPLPTVTWVAGLSMQSQPSAPGPLQQQAYVAPRDAAPPPRLTYVAPQLPASAPIAGETDVELRLVIDKSGRVAEARATNVTRGANPAAADALGAAVVAAARKWRFAAPAAAPLALTTTVTLVPAAKGGVPAISTRERPIPVNVIAATYPEDAQSSKTEGIAVVDVTIDPTGAVSETRVVKATTPSMGEAATEALRKSTFRPGMLDGAPVPVQVTLSIRFALK